MNKDELKQAQDKYVESKELVLMGYSPEYIDDVKEDMRIAFRAGAEWMEAHTPLPEDTVIFQKGVEEGKRLMMEDAVDGEVVKDISNKLAVTAKINLDGFKFGDKVKVIIVKEEK